MVLSKLLINSWLSRIVAGSAEDKESSNCFSKVSRVTLNSFYFLTNSYFIISNSFFSMFTTMANSYSSRPLSVTMKLMIVHWAAVSGLKCGFYNFVTKKSLKFGS